MKKKFELVFAREFLKRLKGIDRETQIRILRELRTLEEQPFVGKRLSGRLNDLMSFRVGDYRIIYQLSEKKIIIRTVGHRKKSMKNEKCSIWDIFPHKGSYALIPAVEPS